MDLKIYIDDQLCDSPNVKFARSFKGFEFGAYTTRRTSYTNVFTLPFTPTNDKILGHGRYIESASRIVYTQPKLRIYVDGVEVLGKGLVSIRKAASGYDIYVVDTVISFFEAIAEKKMNQLDLSDLNCAWTYAEMQARANVYYYGGSGQALSAPRIDYGKATLNGALDELDLSDKYLPSLMYRRLIEQIFEDAGYTLDLTLWGMINEFNFSALGFCNPRFEYNPEFISQYSINASVANQNYNGPSDSLINLTSTSSLWNNTNYKYVHTGFGMTFKFVISIGYNGLDVAGSEISVQLKKNGTAIHTVANTTAIDSGVITGEYTAAIVAGDEITLTVTAPLQADLTIAQYPGSNMLELIPQATPVPSSTINWAACFFPPQLKQIDIIKDFIITYNLILDESNGTVRVREINYIMTQETPVDWTNKVEGEPQVEFLPVGWAQENLFKNKISSNDSLKLLSLPDSSLLINNTNLPDKITKYECPFHATPYVRYQCYNTSAAPTLMKLTTIEIYIDSTDVTVFDKEPVLRRFKLREKNSSDIDKIRFTASGTPTQSYAIAEDQTWFDIIMGAFSYLGETLNDFKLCTYKLRLTAADINQLDVMKPVRIGNSIFIIDSIPDWVPNELNTAKLLKIKTI